MTGEQISNDTLADHEELFTHHRCSTSRASIVQDIQAKQYDRARKRLKRLYEKCFGITHAEWKFLDGLAAVRVPSLAPTFLSRSDGNSRESIGMNLLKGHGPIRDFYGANTDRLHEAGLLRYPRVCGAERRRILNKPFFVLTPEATDCIDKGVVGPNVGDLGESVVHALGVQLYSMYMRIRAVRETGKSATAEHYTDIVLDDYDLDVAIFVYPSGESHKKELYAVGEVKTALSAENEAITAMHKMGGVRCNHKHWIAPKRDLLNKIVNIAAIREWYSLDEVPETLALETNSNSGIRSTNERLTESEFCPNVPGSPLSTPLTEVHSYTMLHRNIKSHYPLLFDPPDVF
ncbi:hypothetical protein [Natronobacterium texcoconense]|uniref:Uncharacterized protein n=1 Tax=Natronobacterium texcoconense TaxID=1095778 RepID=A0A1H1G1S6_NATTX|nr:hypothetical protein [Natronobacterium texcoconense]SDR06806.1 hypothetical protein SAMN04489842_2205 [Natronobacterium texcoconense]